MAAWLELHHINIVGGDATLLLLRDDTGGATKTTFRALIDSGAESSGAKYLRSYLDTIGEFKKDRPNPAGDANTCYFDLIICTHLHTDHIKGFTYFYDSGEPFAPAYFIDTAGANHKTQPPTYADIGAQKDNATESLRYTTYIYDSIETAKSARIPLPFTDLLNTTDTGFVDLMDSFPAAKAAGLSMKVVYANGIMAKLTDVVKRADLFALPVNDRDEMLKPGPDQRINRYREGTSPNDYSISTVIQFGDFTYFTSGDLSGDIPKPGSSRSYKDLERYVIEGLQNAGWLRTSATQPEGFDAVKIAHHGSNYSTYTVDDQNNFLAKVKPTMMVVPTNQKKQVPGAEMLGRAQSYLETVQAGGPKEDRAIAGILTANGTVYEFGAKTDQYEKMADLYNISSVVGPRARPYIATNLISRPQQISQNVTKYTLSNEQNGAVILQAPPGAPHVAGAGHGNPLADTSIAFERFTAISRSGGINFAAMPATNLGARQKVPKLGLPYFGTKRLVDRNLISEIAGQIYDWAGNQTSVKAGFTCLRTYYPFIVDDWGNGTVTRGNFVDVAAPKLITCLQSCYDITDLANSSYFFEKIGYRNNPGTLIKTSNSVVTRDFMQRNLFDPIADRARVIENEIKFKRTADAEQLNGSKPKRQRKRRRLKATDPSYWGDYHG